ncbi:Tn7 transposase TnsA N-terminal domain-containing protein [Fodinisporobacter ferrooxydans]|uniref:Tn7 transposase TnsA N-terminal domain-containing protein n=1 Tax=Fodinisporobacter ferrooxydans TaxID=2901836 RepID=A0ABY4CNG7_9BACL|nr:Tn7 transposase TnsA N-terminal domain-containing protein [Alicyclobacillaceae bacterium MYW30-H2]
MERKCKHCDKVFEVRANQVVAGEGLFCSRQCLYESMKKRSLNTCINCGKQYEVKPHKKDSKYCSRPCYWEDKKRKLQGSPFPKPTGRIDINCHQCGKSFSKTLNSTRLYCSRKCSDAAKVVMEERTCPICKKKFESRVQSKHQRKKELCCSQECEAQYRIRYGKRRGNKKIPDELLIIELKRVCEYIGRIPNIRDIERYGIYSYDVFLDRWGKWDNALEHASMKLPSQAEKLAIGKKLYCIDVFKKKNGSDEPYDSEYEKLYMDRLEKDESIVFWTRRHGIFWETDNISYVPDFLVVRHDGCTVVEIKPEIYLDEELNQRKVELAKRKCEELGYKFEVITDQELIQE